MRTFLALFIALSMGLGGCATTNSVNAPSTASVKSKIVEAQGSVKNAKAASNRSSKLIHSFKTDAERIDYKATKALELL